MKLEGIQREKKENGGLKGRRERTGNEEKQDENTCDSQEVGREELESELRLTRWGRGTETKYLCRWVHCY